MSTAFPGPLGQHTRTTSNESAFSHEDSHHEPVLVLFNGAYILPNTTYERPQWESDAQIAARKAMAKRSSRSYASRVSRTRSRKKEVLRKPAKPTLDTSFTRNKGIIPRQVYPKDSDLRTSGTIKKSPWLQLGRSGTKGKGLGIIKGTPQPESFGKDFEVSTNLDPKTADSLAPGGRTWMDISPSDRPIPIGISIPSDSVSDFSPYQTTRYRSESDATLVTPSIIITPAAAMKSIWSPDTESEYTPSVYSRVTSNAYGTTADVPPVPALPADLTKSSRGNFDLTRHQEKIGGTSSHNRNGTLDSAGTAFEDMEYDLKTRDRITSTGTVFEEDEIPLRNKETRTSNLSLNTAVAPTPRRSRGWWNVITTPFEFTRTNSVWTQDGRNTEKTPDIPMVPQRYGGVNDSPSTPSTYIWSATEKSPSPISHSPMVPMNLAMAKPPISSQERQARQVSHSLNAESLHGIGVRGVSDEANGNTSNYISANNTKTPDEPWQQVEHTQSSKEVDIASPMVGTAAIGAVLMPRQVLEQLPPPPVNVEKGLIDKQTNADTHARGSHVLPAREVRQTSPPVPRALKPDLPTSNIQRSPSPPQFPPPPIHTIHNSPGIPQEFKLNINTPSANTSQTPPIYFAPPPSVNKQVEPSLPPQDIRLHIHTSGGQNVQTTPLQFAPPPHFSKTSPQSTYDHSSRASSPASTPDLKPKKRHRKVFNILDWLPSRRGKHEEAKQEKKQEKKKRRGRKWCWGCCCCLLILVLLAIIIPVVVVATRKHNSNSSKTTEPPSPITSQWLNLTGYPPMPTGVSTVAQPEAVNEQSGCIAPATVWSCAVPKEDQQAISPNQPNQPDFKFEITFENGTVADPSKTLPAKRAANPASAAALVRSRFLNLRAAPSASPAPPSLSDYKFLGQTTDHNQSPFEGENTPFFISVLDPTVTTSSRLAKRADSTNITDAIPPPQLNPDGTAAPANLLPLASGQPLRLFNRGQNDEYYGFFIYYDRAIFLKEILRNFTRGGNPADLNGGSNFDAATMRCTWAQTRFLVQIWTRSQTQKPLLGSSANTSSEADLKRPGTFPYPVTVTIDRHGGNSQDKMIYCYGMDSSGKIANIASNKQFLIEDPTFGGTPVNPNQGPDGNVTGPIDGGSGGCGCTWQNWLA